MPDSNRSTGPPTPIVNATSSPCFSSFSLGNGLVFDEYASSGVIEIPAQQTRTHALILRTGSPTHVEWRAGGRDRYGELAPGSTSLVPVGIEPAIRIERPLPGTAYILRIQPSVFNRNIAEIVRGGRVELSRQMKLDDPQICRLMKTLAADIADGSPSGLLFAESIATALSAHVFERYSAARVRPEQHRGGLARQQLSRVLDYIHANLADKLDLSTLAQEAGINLYHFARAFKQSTGESPYQYVLRRRIEQAKHLLRDPRMSVIEASVRTGFVDQSHFSKVFRRLVGVAPSHYRQGW